MQAIVSVSSLGFSSRIMLCEPHVLTRNTHNMTPFVKISLALPAHHAFDTAEMLTSCSFQLHLQLSPNLYGEDAVPDRTVNLI
jgi:hypothetical protein